LASNSDDKTIKIWENYRLIKTLEGHEAYILALLQLKDGRLISKAYDGTIRIWNAEEDFRLTHIIRTSVDGIKNLVQTTDGLLPQGMLQGRLLLGIQREILMFRMYLRA
jgi:WD40 repeat protein